MFEYSCKLVKVIDGDTIDIDIDLGFEFGYVINESGCMVLIHLSHEHATLMRKNTD